MIPLVRAEVLKYVTTRTSWGLTLGMFLTGAGFAALFGGLLIYGDILDGIKLVDVVPELTLARIVYTAGIQFGYLLALIIGILSIGQEFRHKTISGTFLATPKRERVIGAKVVALVVIAAVSGLAHVIGVLIGGGIILATADLPIYPDPAQLTKTLLLMLLVLALWSLMGLGIGVLIPNQVAALSIAIAFAWILEPLAGFFLTFADWGDPIARVLPSQATAATLDVFTGTDAQLTQTLGGAADPLAWWLAALVLLAYAAVMATLGLVRTRTRDIA